MLKKNLFYNSLLSVSQFIFPLITFPFVSRVLGPSGLGSISFIDSFTQYFILFSALGIPMYGVREIAKVKGDKVALNKIFSEILFIHFISTLIFSIVYILSGLFITELNGHFDLIVIGILMMFCNVLAVEWFFQGIEEFFYVAIRTLAIRSISILLLFLLLNSNSSPSVYYSILAASFLLTAIANVYAVRDKVSLQYKSLQLKRHLKPLIIILGSSLAVSVYILMDNIILGFMKGDTAVGFYSTALRIVRIPFAIFGAICAVMIPQISQAYNKKDSTLIDSLIHKSFSFVCVAGLPVSMGVFISSSFLINTFAGNKYQESILALQILSPVILLVGLNNLFAIQLLGPLGKDKLLLISVLIGMAFSLVLNLCFIPVLSYLGTALTNMLTEGVVTIAAYLFVRRYINLKIDPKIFVQSAIGAALFLPISYTVRLFHLDFFVQEVLIIVLCILFYLIYAWFFIRNVYIDSVKLQIVAKLKTSLAR